MITTGGSGEIRSKKESGSAKDPYVSMVAGGKLVYQVQS